MLAFNKFFNNKYNKILLSHFVDNNVENGMYLATGEFLDIIDALNLKEYTDGISSELGSLQEIVNGLFNGTITTQQCIDDGLIDSDTGAQVRKFSGYNSAYKTMEYNDDLGNMKITYTKPLSITPGFYRNDEDETTNSDLYMVFFHNSVASYLKTSDNTNRNLTSYVAFSITSEGNGGDIELDHDDKIDYLDAFEIQVALPKELL